MQKGSLKRNSRERERERENRAGALEGRRGKERSEDKRGSRTTPRFSLSPPLESTPAFSRDSVGAFGWLFLEKSSGKRQFILRFE